VTDWLDGEVEEPATEPANQALIDAIYDDVSPPTKYPSLPENVDPKFVETVRAARRLRPQQRTFIRTLVQCHGNASRAVKQYNLRIQPNITADRARRWTRNPDFVRVLQAAKDEFMGLAGIDPAGVLMKSQALYEQSLEPKPILYQGEHTGFEEYDAGTAARMIEFQGKAVGIGADEHKTKVVVQVIDMSGEPEKVVSVDGR
jgi:hypothetical protein